MKKTKLLLILMFFCLLPTITNAATNPYKKTSSYGTNCTWYAWQMAYEKGRVTLPGWGNAKEWYKDAKNDGYSVGTTAKANSIVVWGNWTSYGHVGYVEKVEGDTLYVWDSTGPCIDETDPEYIECMANGVSEESDRACKANAKKTSCQYKTTDEYYEVTGYIYLNEKPKPNSSSSTNQNTTTKKDKQETTKKSNNAYLKTIELSNGIINFTKDNYIYEISLTNEIDLINISATPEDKNSKIKGTGEYKLNEGSNIIKILVTAEDSTTKEYTLNITRESPKDISENNTSQDKSDNKESLETKKEPEEKNTQEEKTKLLKPLLITISTIIVISFGIYILKRKRK